jgi:hypothetical protein
LLVATFLSVASSAELFKPTINKVLSYLTGTQNSSELKEHRVPEPKLEGDAVPPKEQVVQKPKADVPEPKLGGGGDAVPPKEQVVQKPRADVPEPKLGGGGDAVPPKEQVVQKPTGLADPEKNGSSLAYVQPEDRVVQDPRAEVQVLSKVDVPLRLSVWCTSHQAFADIADSGMKTVTLLKGRRVAFNAHGGRYHIIVVTPGQPSISHEVDVEGGKVNRLSIRFVRLTSEKVGSRTALPMDGRYVIAVERVKKASGDDVYTESSASDDEKPDVEKDGGDGGDVSDERQRQKQSIFAANLGITYERVPYNDGTFGARLIKAPKPGSPAAQVGLEPGDIVFELDGMRFRTPQDVLAHVAQTTMLIVDVRTDRVMRVMVSIPSTTAGRARLGDP